MSYLTKEELSGIEPLTGVYWHTTTSSTKWLYDMTSDVFISPSGRIAEAPGSTFEGQVSNEELKALQMAATLNEEQEQAAITTFLDDAFGPLAEEVDQPEETILKIRTNSYTLDNGKVEVNEVVITGV